MTYLVTIFLILGIIYFIKKLIEPVKPPAPVIVELKMPELKYFESPFQDVVDKTEDDKYWDGPPPTHEQRRVTLNRLVEFFKQFPESPLKDSYPQQANMAAALLRYQELNLLLQTGQINEESYNEELEKILPLIDITEDLP
jgi:hypothetical protein